MRQPHVYRSKRSKRYVYWFAYSDGEFREGRREPPFAVWRDALAGHDLRGALGDLGFEDGGEIFNYPAKGPAITPVDLKRYRRNDIVLVTTRLPMDDPTIGPRMQIPQSRTALEAAIFEALRPWLKICSRTEIVCTDQVARLAPPVAPYQSIVFREMGSAAFTERLEPATRNKVKGDKANPLTMAYLIHVQHMWKNGPALLAAFSLSSNDTLIWAYLLKTKYRDLLCSRRFVLAEMKTGGWPVRPPSMDWAESWPHRIVGEVKPPSSGTPLRAIG